MAAGGGGAWKVAYADFVTAMMAFFMVMWLVAQNKPVREAVADYFQNPSGRGKHAGGSLKPQFRKNLHQGGSKVLNQGTEGNGSESGDSATESPLPENNRTDGTGEVTPLLKPPGQRSSIGTLVAFVEASADLDEQTTAQLQVFLPTLLGKTNRIELRGHASRRPLPADSPIRDPWQLSYARCQTVMKFLIEHGVEPKRIRLSQAAGNEPYSQRIESDWLAQNSRVEIYLLNEFVEDHTTPAVGKGGVDKGPAGKGPAPPAAVHAAATH